MTLPRPGCLVRSTLSLLGVLFVPLGIWFLRDDKHRYWTQSVALFSQLCIDRGEGVLDGLER